MAALRCWIHAVGQFKSDTDGRFAAVRQDRVHPEPLVGLKIRSLSRPPQCSSAVFHRRLKDSTVT
jgi:hypothetical protein